MLKVQLYKDIDPLSCIYKEIVNTSVDKYGRKMIAIQNPKRFGIKSWINEFNKRQHFYFGKRLALVAFELESDSFWKRNQIIIELM